MSSESAQRGDVPLARPPLRHGVVDLEEGVGVARALGKVRVQREGAAHTGSARPRTHLPGPDDPPVLAVAEHHDGLTDAEVIGVHPEDRAVGLGSPAAALAMVFKLVERPEAAA
jgi:hypothetical protein